MLFLADYSGVSSAAAVNANVTPTTTTTTPTTMGATQMGEAADETADETAAESRKLRLRYISTYSTNLLPSAEMRVSC